MDLDDLRRALAEAGEHGARDDVARARTIVGLRAQRRRRRTRGIVSATMLVGAIAVIVVVLAIAGGGANPRTPVVVTQPPATYQPLPSRAGAAMAYDGAHRDVVLFGGQDLHGVFGDTWTWDGHGWVAMHPAVSPPARTGATMAYDPRSKTVLLFGGTAPRGHLPTHGFVDLWSWNGTTWRQLHPEHAPPWSSGLAMSWDPASKSVILLTLPSSHPNVDVTPDGGGARGNAPFGTWRWNGSDWRELPTLTAPLFVSAGPAFHTTPRLMALPHGRGLLFFSWSIYTGSCGGAAVRCGSPPDPTGTLQSQTFTWNGTRWTERQPRRAPTGFLLPASPDRRGTPTIFESGARWRWTGTDWSESRVTGPSPFPEGTAVYDDHDHDVVAYAGRFGTDGAYFDTWTWDGSWVRRDGPIDPLTTTTTTTTTRPPLPTTTVAPVRSCSSSQLQVAYDKDLGSLMQQPGAYFAVTNSSSAPCTLDGTPRVQLFDTAHRPVAMHQRTGSSYEIVDPGARVVSVAPGATVYFGIGWSDVNQATGGTEQGCVSIGSASVVVPGGSHAFDVTARLGELYCPPGISVTAIAPKGAFNPSTP